MKASLFLLKRILVDYLNEKELVFLFHVIDITMKKLKKKNMFWIKCKIYVKSMYSFEEID